MNVAILFTLTIFVSSSLLFLVQPMIAKMVLPELGGTAAVWTTCMLFFQTLLLLGYGYTHFGTKYLKLKTFSIIHIVLLIVGFALLPFAIPELSISSSDRPISWLLAALLVAVGLPFLVVSSCSPLLQFWFSKTDHPRKNDPYFLYAASNIGSMLALLGYPFIVEPTWGVLDQAVNWKIGYGVLILGTTGCLVSIRSSFTLEKDEKPQVAPTDSVADSVEPKTLLRWIAYAFIPSSLMLGFTQYATTDLASLPLLWIIPLAVYLLTFVVAFSTVGESKRRVFHSIVGWLVPLVVAATFIVRWQGGSFWVRLAVAGTTFTILAWYFHQQLAFERPKPAQLTMFFLMMSIGGALGGVFNALIVPVIFTSAIEYFVVLALAVAVASVPKVVDSFSPGRNVFETIVAVGVVVGTLFGCAFVTKLYSVELVIGLLFAVIMFVVSSKFRGLRNAVFATVLLACIGVVVTTSVATERSFFGYYRVYDRSHEEEKIRVFSMGTTNHGSQSIALRRYEPIGYHYRESGLGEVLDRSGQYNVLVIGLGAGVMAAYAKPDDTFVLIEIDPVVERLARKHFTYLSDCGDACTVKVGDGRKLTELEPEGFYDVISLDAFGSDAVPAHLLTKEAIAMYLTKLKPDGVLVFNVANRFLYVESIVGAAARDLGLSVKTKRVSKTREDLKRQMLTTLYTVVARDDETLGNYVDVEDGWRETTALERAWTDDYSSLTGLFR